MKDNPLSILNYSGDPYKVGTDYGFFLKDKLEQIIRNLLDDGLIAAGLLNKQKMEKESMQWFHKIPSHYQEEMKGIAGATGIPLKRIVDYHYCGYALQSCTSIIYHVNGELWIGHNNDWYNFGTYTAVARAINNRVPTLTFGWTGDVCATIGMNKEKLWIQINGLPESHNSHQAKPFIPSIFLVREALETCKSIK